jgi:hypothetical protein
MITRNSAADLVESTLGTLVLMLSVGIGLALWRLDGVLGIAGWYLWAVVLCGAAVGGLALLHGVRASWPWFPDDDN